MVTTPESLDRRGTYIGSQFPNVARPNTLTFTSPSVAPDVRTLYCLPQAEHVVTRPDGGYLTSQLSADVVNTKTPQELTVVKLGMPGELSPTDNSLRAFSP